MDFEVGGSGLSCLDVVVVIEEFVNVDLFIVVYISIYNMVLWMVLMWGIEMLCVVWGIDLFLGSKLVLYCLIELGVGLDVVLLKISVVCEGEYYVLNGVKVFIFGVGVIELLVVMVWIGGVGVGGISVIVVLVDLLGISYGCKEEKMGWNSQFICGIIFENVCVLVSYFLGEEGGGFKLVMKGLDGGCINIVVCLLGVV